MRIFYRRPLSLILCIMLGAFSLFAFLAEPYTYILWTLALLLFGLSFVKINIDIPRVLIRVASLSFILSSVLSFYYFNFYYRAYEKFDGNIEVYSEITDINTNDYYTYLTVETITVNGEDHSHYKFLVMLDYEEKKGAPDFKIGKKLNFKGEISDFSSDSSDFNANSYYLSKGYSAKIIELTDLVLSGEEKFTLSSYFNSKRSDIAEFIIENSNEEAGGLLVALLLGEKEFLSPEIELDFRRIGISHILALSGLHLAILVLGFAELLALLHIGKKPRTLFTLIFTIIYMALTGFPISVVRAGIMLIIASSLYLLANATDSFTNLAIAVFSIVLASPYAIFDVSLLLSAFATLGIVALSDLPKAYPRKRGIKNALLNSLTVSLFAISATFLISVLSFGEISVISPISTLVFSLIIEIFLYFGTFFLVFVGIIPLGNILIFLSDVIKDLASYFSSLRYINVSTDFTLIKIFAFAFTVVFFLFLVINVKRKRLGVALISVLMSVLLVSGSLLAYNAENESRLSYKLNQYGDVLLITENGESTIFESNVYTTARINETLSYLKDEKLTRLDNYILTSYNTKMIPALHSLMSDVKINNIYVPTPKTLEERQIYYQLLSLNEDFSAEIILYGPNPISFSGFKFTLLYRDGETASYEIVHDNKKYLIALSGILESRGANLTLERIYESDIVIFTRHGTTYKNYNFVYEFKKPKVIIVSSKKMYVPSVTVSNYEKSGAKIIFTPEIYDFIR